MKKFYLALCVVFFSTFTQLLAQQSLKTTFVSSFVDPTPVIQNSQNVTKYNDVWGYVDDQGREYAIFGSRVSSLFVDITDATNPTLVTEILNTTGNGTTWRDYKTYQNYAYSICDSCTEGMYVYDLSNLPNSVTVVNKITSEFGRSHNIYIDEAHGRLYVVGMGGQTDLIVYDLTADPANPVLLAEIDFDKVLDPASTSDFFYIHDIYVRDNILYASHGNYGYYMWDANNLANIIKLGEDDYGNYNHSSWLSECGEYAYVAEEVPLGLPLQVVDIATLQTQASSNIAQVQDNLEPVDPITDTQSTYHNPYVKGDLLYISNYEDGLKVYDIRNPASPVLYAYYDTYSPNDDSDSYSGYKGAWGTYPFLPSGNILISDSTFGLTIVKVDDFPVCLGDSHVLFVESFSEIEYYRDNVSTFTNATIDNNVNSVYGAGECIELNPDFEIKIGSQVLFTIETCVD